jgi:medium-chain acyl-[acyl-carrier-protein] hydrolase
LQEGTMTSKWLMRWAPLQQGSDVRLFCFPYAGGGAAAYRLWPRLLDSVDLCAIQLPGRANRLHERPLDDMESLVDRVRLELLPYLDKPFAFFGHSMGAVVSAEVCRLLAKRGEPLPMQLFVSGRRPPGMAGPELPLRQLSDNAFVAEIDRRYGGIPAEIAAEPDILDLLLPALRADIAALEMHRPPPLREPLDCPILALGGVDDRLAPRAHLEAWRRETRSDFRVQMFAGGHFYLDQSREAVAAELSKTLTARLQRSHEISR